MVHYIIDWDTVIIGFTILLFISFLVAWMGSIKKRDGNTKDYLKVFFCRAAFWGYVTMVITITLLPLYVPPGEESYITPAVNLFPFDGWQHMGVKTLILNVLGNICLFIPWYFLGRMSGYKLFENMKLLTVVTLIIILGIETLQYAEGIAGLSMEPRVSDISDVILNGIGFGIGALLFAAHMYFGKKRSTQ